MQSIQHVTFEINYKYFLWQLKLVRATKLYYEQSFTQVSMGVISLEFIVRESSQNSTGLVQLAPSDNLISSIWICNSDISPILFQIKLDRSIPRSE